MEDLKRFAEQLVNLNVEEMKQLANILKEEYGIEPQKADVVTSEKKVKNCQNVKQGRSFEYKKEQEALRRLLMQKQAKLFNYVKKEHKSLRRNKN